MYVRVLICKIVLNTHLILFKNLMSPKVFTKTIL